jgi:hypothetical protein
VVERHIELPTKGESFSPESLGRININIGPVGSAYHGILQEVRSVVKGDKTFSAIYVEGLYGTGKTLALRKAVFDIMSGPHKEEYEKVIPIYFYLGEMDFALLKGFKDYIEDVKAYVKDGEELPVKPNIMGRREDWDKRRPVLEETLKKAGEVEGKYKDEAVREVLGFFEILKVLNRMGYYPLLVFDEIERVIYTGDGLKSDVGRRAFATFATNYLELTRGHIYRGVFVISTTRPIRELVTMAVNERRPHITLIFGQLGLSLDKPWDFPMVREHIVYDLTVTLSWSEEHLMKLAEEYGLSLDQNVIRLLSTVLPTPRAIIQIDRRARSYLGGAPQVVSLKEFYAMIKHRIADFIEKLKKERVDGKPVIGVGALWHERFLKLLENGYFFVHYNAYDRVAEVLKTEETEVTDPKRARQRVSQLMRKLSELGLYEAVGTGEYRLNPYLLAYALEIDRLPDGSPANIEEVLKKIKDAVIRARKKQREREERKKKQAEGAQG